MNEFNKGHLESIYESIEEKRKTRDGYIQQVQKLDSDIQKDILEYRMESVSRVLDFIHGNYSIAVDKLDTLITHCCNKLHGNLDGIELDLDKV